MSYRCFFLRRRFVLYLEGGVAPRQAKRLERHLVGCRECDELLTRLRSGDLAGRQFGRLGRQAGHRPPEFEEILAGIGATLDRPARPARTGGKLLQALLTATGAPVLVRPGLGSPAPGFTRGSTSATPLAVRILIALVLAQSVLLVVSFRKMPSRVTAGDVRTEGGPALQGYAPVRIAEFSSNSEFRVVTEGFVKEVYFDEHEKSLHIKLVEAPHKPEPFVICEIKDLGGLTIPQPGSRVRVYGTARYDAQPGRGWHEVNPVLAMAVLKR